MEKINKTKKQAEKEGAPPSKRYLDPVKRQVIAEREGRRTALEAVGRSSYGKNQQNKKTSREGVSACERELVTIHIATNI